MSTTGALIGRPEPRRKRRTRAVSIIATTEVPVKTGLASGGDVEVTPLAAGTLAEGDRVVVNQKVPPPAGGGASDPPATDGGAPGTAATDPPASGLTGTTP